MEALRRFVWTLCAALVLVGLLKSFFVKSKEGTRQMFAFVCGVFLILTAVRSFPHTLSLPRFSVSAASAQAQQFASFTRGQVLTQTKEAFTAYLQQLFSAAGIAYEEIFLMMDSAEDSRITLTKVSVTLIYEQDLPRARAVLREVLEPGVEAEVKIVAG